MPKLSNFSSLFTEILRKLEFTRGSSEVLGVRNATGGALVIRRSEARYEDPSDRSCRPGHATPATGAGTPGCQGVGVCGARGVGHAVRRALDARATVPTAVQLILIFHSKTESEGERPRERGREGVKMAGS